jgi:hypothetical protein
MPPATTRSSKAQVPPLGGTPAQRARPATVKPFFGLIDSVLVADPTEFHFDGAISHEHAVAVWTWMARDLAPDLIGGVDSPQGFEVVLPEILTRLRDTLAATVDAHDQRRRLSTQVGGDDVLARLPIVLGALKCRALLEKAKGFGRAINAMQDEAMIAPAVQSLPFQDKATATFLTQAMVGEIANPSRLVTAIIKLANGSTDAAIIRAGFAPVIDALLSHAQNQLPALGQAGPFADIDLVCKATDRFHRLLRAINGNVELGRMSHWATVIAALIKKASQLIEPPLRDVPTNVSQSLRRRDGADRLDADLLLAALNGVYLLATVRDCRDSLALNALFDQTWTMVGQALELHVNRNLEILRANPADRITSGRLEAGIKMAELRFNAEYADVLRRARDVAERRPAAAEANPGAADQA